ncbi:MAG: penicillin acylase family protein, partial [Candidatus Hodarchaeales archaeon]
MQRNQKFALINMLIAFIISIIVIAALSTPLGIIPPVGSLLLPGNGVWNVPQEVASYEELTIPGLANEVTHVYRDEWGIPHIYGEDLGDILFALGYCHAQDRWFQMDLFRRNARGLLSELLGPIMIEQDKFNLMKMGEYWANETLKVFQTSSDPAIREMYPSFQMYTNGVNFYLEKHPDAKPLEYYLLDAKIRPWEMLDTLVLVKYLSEHFTWGYYDMIRYQAVQALSGDDYNELFGTPWPYQLPVTVDYGEYDDISVPESRNNSFSIKDEANSVSTINSLVSQTINQFLKGLENLPQEKIRLEWELTAGFSVQGSNNWVVSGNKTASGKPILAGDQHSSWILPGLWYEAHLVDMSSDLNVYGLTFAGIPFPIAGNTRYIAWDETIAFYDLIDWYYYNEVNETHYYYKGEATPYKTMEFTIPVKGQAPVTFVANSTVHGPVLTGLVPTINVDNSSNLVIACKWVAQNVTRDYLAIWGYLHAKDVYEFDEATQYFEMLPLNIAYADIHGNIGMRPSGKVPIRNDTGIPSWHTGWGGMPYNGSAGQGEWIGYLPFEDLPHSVNPSQGYLASANQVMAGPDYPNINVLFQGGAPGYRARRINNLLASNNQITIEDTISFQTDVYSERAGNFTPFLLNALDSLSSLTPQQQNAYNELTTWDFIM